MSTYQTLHQAASEVAKKMDDMQVARKNNKKFDGKKLIELAAKARKTFSDEDLNRLSYK